MLLAYENGTEPRPPSPGLLAPEVTKVDPPMNSSAKHGISRIILRIDSPYDIKPFAKVLGTLRRA